MAIDVQQIVQACSGPVAPATMAAIVGTESGGDPWAIYVNGMGPKGSMRFPSQAAAVAAATHYVRLGYKVDMGLAQVDSENLGHFGLSIQQVFNPCTNVRTGAMILAGAYIQALKAGYAPGASALTHGFEAYNSGQTTGDYSYAQTVWRHAGVSLPTNFRGGGASPIIPSTAAGAALPESPYLAGISVAVVAPPAWILAGHAPKSRPRTASVVVSMEP
ncbi:transglycosylase SLT domain-containing protein [Acidithiobacillus sp.]|uniref:transglycosylase SLT domain-containing protein n=1 Tax=Acidithiobacillus sp. TaxID=1872118 RepID=UPI003D020BA3